MVNPFDKTFFKFILGFSLILCLSFAVLIFVNKYTNQINNNGAVAEKDTTTQSSQASDTGKIVPLNKIERSSKVSQVNQTSPTNKQIQLNQTVKQQINKTQIKK